MNKRTLVIIFCFILLFFWTEIVFAADVEETPSGIVLSGIESYINEYMAQYIGETSPGAAVVLVKDGEMIFSKGYGYANLEKNIPVNSADTVFEYASISKIFVYTTIMRLSEQGRIDLQADIREYLPEDFLKNLKYDKPITMLDIMNHTAGFEDYLFDLIVTQPERILPLEQVLLDFQPTQVNEPGTVSAYSNYAVSLAAYIAEQIIGKDFYEYLQESIFLPLNMNDTSAHPTLVDRPDLVDRKAIGYQSLKDGKFKIGKWSYIQMYPAGSVNGTAEDLARFAVALMPEDGKDSLLFDKRETLDEMFTQSHEMGPEMAGISHGFFEWDGEYRGVGHGGNTISFSTQINLVPEEHFGVIILTNSANEMDIGYGLTEALIGKRDKTVAIGGENLPSEKEVEGSFTNARRMHNGFLELVGYFSLLKVKAMEPNKIELSMVGQTATLVQTKPYVYQKIDSDGTLFKYQFNKVYFDVSNGKVQRISGDYLPLSTGRTMPWLIVSLLIVIISALYFIITPIVLLIGKWRYKKVDAKVPPLNSRVQKIVALLVLCGTATIINNAVLIIRILINTYRSFAEVKIHIFLNYPLVILAALLSILVMMNWKRATTRQKVFLGATIFITATFMSTLISWGFLDVIS